MSESVQDVCAIAGQLASALKIRWFEQEIYEYLPDTGVHERRSLAWLQSKVLGCLIRDYDNLEVTSALVNNVCALLKGLSFTAEGMTPPFWIDSRTPANALLVQNGILRLDRGCPEGAWTLEPFDRTLFEVAALPYPYDPSATCPRWIDFLTWMVGGDRGIVEMIRQFTATAFIVPRLKLERFLWLVGGGRNGKSTAYSVLRYVLGDKATSALGLNAFSGAHNFRLAPILHRRANFCADASIGRRDDMAALNAFVSGDPIAINRKFREHVVIEPTTILFFASNADPLINDPSDAFWRRLLLVRCDQKLDDNEVDPTLVLNLKAEASGILNWLLAAIPEVLQAKAIAIPEKVKRDVADLQAQVNGFRIFAATELEAAESRWCVRADELTAEFNNWARQHNVEVVKGKEIAREMRRMFNSRDTRRRKGEGGKRVLLWRGVRWRTDSSDPADSGDSDLLVSSRHFHVTPSPPWERSDRDAERCAYPFTVGCQSHDERVSSVVVGTGGVIATADEVPDAPSTIVEDSDDISDLLRGLDEDDVAQVQATGGGR
jgi:putative DNA primase/helicase